MTIPAYLPVYVLGCSIVIVVALLIGLSRALERAAWEKAQRARVMRTASFVLVGWFLAAVVLAWLEIYRGAPDRWPTIQYGIFIPIVFGLVGIARSATVARILDAVPQPWIVGVQLYRALGVIFIVLYASGRLPGLFAWPAGAGDVAVGLLAPLVAFACARSAAQSHRAVAVWNIVGIADLAVAVAAGFLTSPSPLQLFALDTPNELISSFPLVMIPIFLVPLSILLHTASLVKLHRERVGTSQGSHMATA